MAILALVASLFLSALGPITSANAAAVAAGFKDHVYGPGVSDPSADKPQSKVWFADGSWWAGMFVDGSDDNRIHRYNATTHAWTATSTVVDQRNGSHGDYLWDAATNSLYVASANSESAADPILVFKLNYNPATDTYTHDPAFTANGVQVGLGPTETVTIAKDSTGQLWVTYQTPNATTGRDVTINRSTTNESTWGTPFGIGEIGADDISAIIAFGGDSVGVMWSDQNPAATQTFFYFSEHADNVADDTDWSEKKTSASGTDEFAEDHVNLKLVATGSGQVLAAVKTNGGPDHIQVLRRDASNGNWSAHVVVGGSQDVTRPQIVVDETAGTAYVFYTSPENEATGNQAIYYKSAPLSTLAFATGGLGTPFIQDGSNDINNVSTSKHNVTSATGLVAIATSDTNETYYHGYLPLGGGAPPPPPPADHPFTDIAGNQFEDEIIWIYQAGITNGCGDGTQFCPNAAVTREEMATFLVRALDLSSSSTDYFPDDNGRFLEPQINALAKAGITNGCTGLPTFCPTDPVTREQMAAFLVRGYALAASATNFFVDDNGRFLEPQINALAQSGVTLGCGPSIYCPLRAVTRAEMAAFIYRAEHLP
jgi:hypothetical protein